MKKDFLPKANPSFDTPDYAIYSEGKQLLFNNCLGYVRLYAKDFQAQGKTVTIIEFGPDGPKQVKI